MGTVLTGFVIIAIIASGQYVAAALHRSLTIPALVLKRSSLVIPVINHTEIALKLILERCRENS